MKKSVYILFLIFFLFGLCFSFGCQNVDNDIETSKTQENAFRLIRQTNKNGEIALIYVFPVNSAELEKLGFNDEQISIFKFYLINYVNAFAQANKNNETDGVSVGNCLYFSDIDGVGFSIHFDNLEAQQNFFGVDPNQESSSTQKESGIFIKKLEIKTSFPFSYTSAKNYQKIFSMAVSSWCNEENLTNQENQILRILDKSLFIYDFSTQENHLKSNVMYQDDLFLHHIFIKTIEDLEKDTSIIFWIAYANRPLWYLIALLGVGAGMVIFYFIYRKKTRNSWQFFVVEI